MSEQILAKEQARYLLIKVEALRWGTKKAAKRPKEQPWRPEAEGADLVTHLSCRLEGKEYRDQYIKVINNSHVLLSAGSLMLKPE